ALMKHSSGSVSGESGPAVRIGRASMAPEEHTVSATLSKINRDISLRHQTRMTFVSFSSSCSKTAGEVICCHCATENSLHEFGFHMMVGRNSMQMPQCHLR